MAVVLLFDGVVDNYAGDSNSGDSLLSAEGGDLSQQQRLCILLLFMMTTGQHNINSDALNLLFLTWPAA